MGGFAATDRQRDGRLPDSRGWQDFDVAVDQHQVRRQSNPQHPRQPLQMRRPGTARRVLKESIARVGLSEHSI